MVKRLTKLTDAQRERMPQWADEWIKRGLSTEPADRAQVEAAIQRCYAYAGIPWPGPVIWVQSPLAGALAAMITGFGATVFFLLLGEMGVWVWPGALGGAIGLVLGLAAGVAVSLATPVPGRHVLDAVRELRVPGGETLYDRETRLQRLKNRATT